VNEVKVNSILSRQIAPLLIVSVALPVLVLAAVGVYFVFQQGYLLWFLAVLAVVTLITRILVWWLHRHDAKVSVQDESIVEPSEDWSDREQEIWGRGNRRIDDCLRVNDEWGGLQEHALQIVRLAAHEYGCTEWDFSVPASLRMFEEVSRRYRRTLQTHVPFVEALKVSHLRYAIQNQENIGRVGKTYRVAKNFWRGVRWLNPAAAVASEVRDYITGELFAKVSLETQWQLKKVFLQEVLSVSMDLYSGRFNIDDAELQPADITKEDCSRMASPLDPVRIAVVGQENSGKSSLINALRGEVTAQVDVLPVVGDTTVYTYSIDGVEHLHLVELPAIDGGKARIDELVFELTESDIVIWMLQANQPARALDAELHYQFEKYYRGEDSLQKKQPVLVGVLNHVDMLSPVSEWNPPYDLGETGVEKVCTINEALQYNRQLLPLGNVIPLSLAPEKTHYNLAHVVARLEQDYQAAVQVQLNRRGREARQRDWSVTEQGKRLARTGKALFGKIVK
jgi:uncharacterized protein